MMTTTNPTPLRSPAPADASPGGDPSREDIDRAHRFLRGLRKPTINSNVPAAVAVQAMFAWHQQETEREREAANLDRNALVSANAEERCNCELPKYGPGEHHDLCLFKPVPTAQPMPHKQIATDRASVGNDDAQPVDPEIEGEIQHIEKMRIVAYLRLQSGIGADFSMAREKGSTSRAAYGGGSLALKRAADAIENDEHHRQAIKDRLVEFAAYRDAHPERMKEPGITHHIQLNDDAAQPMPHKQIATDRASVGNDATQHGEDDDVGPCEGGSHCCCCGPGEPCCDCGAIMPSAACDGEKCWCGAPAAKKVGEEISFDDPTPHRHNLTSYICARHYAQLMGPLGAEQVGCAFTAQPSTPDVPTEAMREAARIIQNWRDGNAGEDDAFDTAGLVAAALGATS